MTEELAQLIYQKQILRNLLQHIVNDAGACDDECYSVAKVFIDQAAKFLKEIP